MEQSDERVNKVENHLKQHVPITETKTKQKIRNQIKNIQTISNAINRKLKPVPHTINRK